MSVRGRKIAITGAGRALGAALAIAAADQGALPLLLGRSQARLEEIATLIEGRTGTRPPAIPCDLADLASIGGAAARIEAEHPDLDILVNSGAQWVGGALVDLTDSAIAAMVDSMLTGTMALTRRLLPILLARPRADIHTVVSMSGLQYARLRGSSLPFRAAKAGQDGFVQGLVEELSATSIRVTSIYPGHIADVLPNEAHWETAPAPDGPLTDRQVVESILFILGMPPNVSIRSLVIERSRSEFLS